jgi:hypothetical protein
LRVLSHVCVEGDTCLSKHPNTRSYIYLGKVIALGGFLLFSGSAYIETLARWARAV